MTYSSRAVMRGAQFVHDDDKVRCIGQGHEVWVSHDPKQPQYAVEEASRLWLRMVEVDDALD